jgi:hypothetical protein
VAVGGARDAEATGNGWPTAAGVRVLGKERERERERERRGGERRRGETKGCKDAQRSSACEQQRT